MKLAHLGWYGRRLLRMSPAEMVHRSGDRTRAWMWRRRQVLPGEDIDPPVSTDRHFVAQLSPGVASDVPTAAREAVLRTASDLLDGQWEVLGVTRSDILSPDWFLDPITGRRAPRDRYAFRINHRSEEEAGNVKQVWELSRHHHLTVLAAAWFLSGDERYAETVDRQLRSWWKENPFLSGIHWTSGIELGVRLIAWTWIRRLLADWPGVADLFERNDLAARQLHWHQQYLSAFRSTGSSANNHVVAEAAGQLVASCVFPWFSESDRWRREAAALLEAELERNTFPSGVNRELASDYHGFVAELGLLAAVEADVFGHPLSDATWTRLCRMVDAAAAVADETLRPPRQGDGDDGRALLVDEPDPNRWPSLLAAGAGLLGALPWWPETPPADVRSTVLTALAGRRRVTDGRPADRPSHFPDAGLTLLRTAPSQRPEIWCRCDGGPHGYLSIAAHAHADALSVEVRHGGVDVLADPGTYCYHGEPQWRGYFRSTLGHNTLELDGKDQSRAGGPFLWLSHASSRLVTVAADDDVESWCAEHDGYLTLDPPARHRRTVRLSRGRRRIEILDRVDGGGGHLCRMAFHLGPSVRASLDGAVAELEWPAVHGSASATLHLPGVLEWSAHVGETDPILGWYSAAFGQKQPAVTLLGRGTCGTHTGDLVTVLQF
ncbi:MAG TPA: alginate lyase family protein [Acidimicrobiales bacterium]|nr:alginate lyase family protein [Acidimicrobiales bacterium]